MYVFFQACAEFLDLAQVQEKKWNKSLQYERHQRLNLEETVEVLARQHNNLERACQRQGGGPPASQDQGAVANDSEEEDDHEFFDAISEHSDIDSIRGSQDSISAASTTSESSGRESDTKPLLPIDEKNGNKLDNTVTSVSTILPSGSFGSMTSYVSICFHN